MLPVEEIFPALKSFLRVQTTAVIVAPPGAGKTTGVPLALLDAPWLAGQTILLLEPRRLAARAAAARMAETLGERVGETVGYRIRGESRTGPKTRIEVVTEGIFTRRILNDPALEGVGCVIFDEFHERSLDADLGLAFAREAQSVLRDDLRLLVMSATLDGERVLSLLPGAQSFHSEGRTFPITTHYLGRDQSLPVERDLARHVARLSAKLSRDPAGTMLVFLPGQGEIHRTAQNLSDIGLPDYVEVHKLFGAMDFRDQAAVLRPATPGHPRIVLATAIAETSLTLDRVEMVVDCGLSRTGRFDAGQSVVRFVTERVSKASADQRRGRAGRTLAGHAYRLWDEEQDRSLIPFGRPEILETDLSQLALSLRLWGVKSTQSLTLLDHPPRAAMDEATRLLQTLGALDAAGDITPHGRQMGQLPMAPRIAHMLLRAAEAGVSDLGAQLAVLLSDNAVGGKVTDLDRRIEGLSRDRSPRTQQARQMAQDWAQQAAKMVAKGAARKPDAALLLAQCFPERVAKARGKPGEFLMANGRGAYVDAHDPLAKADYLAVGDLGGGKDRDRILLAAPISEADLFLCFADQMERTPVLERQPRLKAVEQTRLGALVLKSVTLDTIPADLMASAEADEIRRKGIRALNLTDASASLLARVAFLRTQDPDWPDLSVDVLLSTIEDWLSPYAAGRPLTQIPGGEVYNALQGLLSPEQQRSLNALAPERLEAPTGSNLRIDYEAEGGPRVDVRVQELYGLNRHPTLGPAKLPLTLALLSPAHRPIQITKDLPAFWEGSWADVRKDMKGRYPRHVWPENPREATATTRAKPRGT